MQSLVSHIIERELLLVLGHVQYLRDEVLKLRVDRSLEAILLFFLSLRKLLQTPNSQVLDAVQCSIAMLLSESKETLHIETPSPCLDYLDYEVNDNGLEPAVV